MSESPKPTRKKQCPYCEEYSLECTRVVRDIGELDLIAEVKRTYWCPNCSTGILQHQPKGSYRRIKMPKKYR